MISQTYGEQIYAGVLGKIIGVYMGRPVEGWSYENIVKEFGKIENFVAEHNGFPLIVPDDDISGTFVFYRALEDNGYPKDVTADQIGQTWLNYIIEDKTILWWGGLARSTEHSAYLRLKQGVKPPYSGSFEYNGQSIAEAIGSQIFIDTWAMSNPGNPERAAKMAREAAIVSHAGIAVEAAVYLAAIEALAFDIKDVDELLRSARKYVQGEYGEKLLKLVDDVVEQCNQAADWRQVRDWIQENHGYHLYPGNCPMVPNHLAVIMALKMAGDDFQESISIATSAGWDTDCNAGNVGCLNGIRLGLDAINHGIDLRGPVADRMLVVSSDGGSCISDAVQESRKIIKAASALAGEAAELPENKFAFEYRGSTQGFMLHPEPIHVQAATEVKNAWEEKGEAGLQITYKNLSRGAKASASVATFVDPAPKAKAGTSYFEVYASPSIYSGQTVHMTVKCFEEENPDLQLFIDYYDQNDSISTIEGSPVRLEQGMNEITWKVPDTKGRAIYRLGIRLNSDRMLNGAVVVKSLDWKGSPELFHMGKANELTPGISPFVTRTQWLSAFMTSVKHYGPDYLATISLSHPEENGVMTIGTTDWDDYSIETKLQFVHGKCAGVVARAKGHRRYYAAVFRDNKAEIIKRFDRDVISLAAAAYPTTDDMTHEIRLEAKGNRLTMFVDNEEKVTCTDDSFANGAAGFMVDEGAIVAECLTVKGI